MSKQQSIPQHHHKFLSDHANVFPNMTPPPTNADSEINLLTALQTAFSQDADPELFVAHTEDKIREIEKVIIETCSKNRIRIDDNLYALLESRDGMAEQVQEMDNATQSASEITKNVEQSVAALTEKIQVRQNLDAALMVAAQTRKLTRMYARIEDTIDSRRLYTAFRMLKVLEEETRCVKPGTFLQELVPDTRRLRATITSQARKSFFSWLSSVRKSEAELGSYALHHASKQMSGGRHSLLSSSRLGSMNSLLQSPNSAKQSTESSTDRNRASRSRPWTPLLTPLAPNVSTVLLPRSHTPRSSQRIGVMSPVKSGLSAEPNFRPEIGSEGRGGTRSFANDYKGEVPTLHLRPLLQSILVNDGLELLGDMRGDYRRERLGHLKKILEDVGHVGDESGEGDRESPHKLGSSKARQIETFVFQVCGFFIVERAVEQHANPGMLPRNVVDNEWWGLAHSRMQALLKEQDETAMISAADKAWARALQGGLDMFAQSSGFVS